MGLFNTDEKKAKWGFNRSGSVDKTDPESSQMCTKMQAAIREMLTWYREQNVFMRLVQQRNTCPKRLWDLHPDAQKFNWTRPWATLSSFGVIPIWRGDWTGDNRGPSHLNFSRFLCHNCFCQLCSTSQYWTVSQKLSLFTLHDPVPAGILPQLLFQS